MYDLTWGVKTMEHVSSATGKVVSDHVRIFSTHVHLNVIRIDHLLILIYKWVKF